MAKNKDGVYEPDAVYVKKDQFTDRIDRLNKTVWGSIALMGMVYFAAKAGTRKALQEDREDYYKKAQAADRKTYEEQMYA